MAQLTTLEQGGCGEESMVIGRFNKRDNRRGSAARELRKRRKAWIGSPHRNLWCKVLQLISSQAELGEDPQVGTRRPTLSDLLLMHGKVLRKVTKCWGDLREGEYSASHQPLLLQVPRVD